jgi:branched-chain amino acid transport system ATP-binding protein
MGMLRLRSVNVHYGKIVAARDISLEVREGEIVAIIGRNGAGKSSILRAIMGLVKADAGSIEFRGKSIIGLRPHEITNLGIIYVPEGRHIFTDHKVHDNLLLGAYRYYFKKNKDDFKNTLQNEYTRFPILFQRKKQYARVLSGGEQQMLAISRGLMAKPNLLLLDEPSLGLAPVVVKTIIRNIATLNEGGMTILIVDQAAKLVLEVAHYAYVLETGQIAIKGNAKEVANDDRVRKAYLG